MKVIKGLTVSASLAAFMALSSPAKATQLLDHETLDQGYAQSAPASSDDEKKDEKDKKKKKGDKDKKGDKEGGCGADKDKKGKDGEKSCGQGSCG